MSRELDSEVDNHTTADDHSLDIRMTGDTVLLKTLIKLQHPIF